MPRRKVPGVTVDEEAHQRHLQRRATIRAARGKRGAPKSITDPPAGAVGAVSSVLDSFATRNAPPYNGVLGTPPNWIPTPKLYDFHAAREALLKSPLVRAWRSGRGHDQRAADADIVRGWLEAYIAAVNWKSGQPPSMDYPDEHADHLRVLAEVWLMVEAGPDEGYRKYLGEAAHRELSTQVASGALKQRNREIARQPRSRRGDPVTQAIATILKSNPSLSAKEVGKQLEQRGLLISTGLKDRVSRARRKIRA